MRCDQCSEEVPLPTPGYGYLCRACRAELAATILFNAITSNMNAHRDGRGGSPWDILRDARREALNLGIEYWSKEQEVPCRG
jgi:hypothetical protein